MCGIAGILRHDGPVSDAEIEDVTGTLSHRGPDGAGYFRSGGLVLGHRRLSIIDLAGGDQPIFNEDGSIAIVFNGEIYNYRELRVELLKRGHVLKTESDTEVIVHLYEEQGVDCVTQLNGMFAFALWDANRQRLMLARDRLGEKPLYYRVEPTQLTFASEMKAVLRAGSQRTAPTLSPTALDDFLAYGYVPAPRAIFAGIEKLPAACTAVYERGQLSVHRYWQLDDPSRPRIVASEPELVERLSALFADAVRIRLRADVPVGAFLSGGIDSSLVVAQAAQVAETRLMTFTVGFDEHDFDESRFARSLAERFGTEHHEIRVTDATFDVLPSLVAQFDEPFADSSAIPTYYICRAARRHVTVCLSGDGGDELFGGYSQYRWEPLERQVQWMSPALRRGMFGGAAALLPREMAGRGWLGRLAESGARRHQRAVGIFPPEERLELLRPEAGIPVDRDAWLLAPYFGGERPEMERRMLADQASYLPDDILVKMDRDSMLNSLEGRVPLLDHRIVEFANAIPLTARISGDVQKVLLKRLLGRFGLDEVARRPKRGFGLPIVPWLGARAAELDDLLLGSEARSRTFFRPQVVRRWLKASQAGKRDFGARLFALVWFEHWCRQHRVG